MSMVVRKVWIYLLFCLSLVYNGRKINGVLNKMLIEVSVFWPEET